MPRKAKTIADYQAGFEYTYVQKNRTYWCFVSRCMEILVKYFKGKHPKEIFVADARYFLAQRRRKVNAGALYKEICVYKAFFNWLILHSVLNQSHNPFRAAGKPYVKKSERISMSKARAVEIRELLAKALFPLPEDEERAIRLLKKLPPSADATPQQTQSHPSNPNTTTEPPFLADVQALPESQPPIETADY